MLRMISFSKNSTNLKMSSTLSKGDYFVKYSKNIGKKPVERRVWVELIPSLSLHYQTKANSSIDFECILEIRLGQNTKEFLPYKSPSLEDRAFSVIYNEKGKYKTLNLVAKDRDTCLFWISTLQVMLAAEEPTMSPVALSDWMKGLWESIDTNSQNILDLDQITMLMKKLNVQLSRREIKSNLKQVNLSTLDFNQFQQFYRNIRFRSDIAELFSVLCQSNQSYLTLDEFSKFVVDTQKYKWSERRIVDTYQKFANQDQHCDIDHFTAFLLSSRNSIKKKAQFTASDFDRPLSDYFINSSHNTYLLSDQIVGDSSVEGYIRAILKGCRCLELDCWDGAKDPIIFHGRTLTSKISFRDAVQAIMKYAFVSTESPLILSLEIHCCLDQQDMLASIMLDVFGDYLVTAPLIDSERLPSPKALERKILLKAKISSMDDDAESDEEEKESISSPDESAPIVRGRSSLISWVSSSTPVASTGGASDMTRKGKNKRFLSKNLSNLVVYFRGKPSKDIDFPLGGELKFNQIFSLNDRKAASLMLKSLSEFKNLTKNRMIRVYPSIIRVNSSNFDPIPHWNAGTQMVALNFQTQDRALDLNRALFEDSNGYGFIPRPTCIFDYPSRATPVMTFFIYIISAQQINIDGSLSDRIRAEVAIEMIGLESDCKRVKTASIKSNGMNSIWKEEFSFSVFCPELAFLRIEILTSDTSSIGYSVTRTFTTTVASLEEGYKHIPLRSNLATMNLSTVFVKITRKLE